MGILQLHVVCVVFILLVEKCKGKTNIESPDAYFVFAYLIIVLHLTIIITLIWIHVVLNTEYCLYALDRYY